MATRSMKGFEAWLAFEETRKTGGRKRVSATFGLIPRFPAELGQRKGEGRSISAEDLLWEHGPPSRLPPVFSGLA
jgi:hypothetical protein